MNVPLEFVPAECTGTQAPRPRLHEAGEGAMAAHRIRAPASRVAELARPRDNRRMKRRYRGAQDYRHDGGEGSREPHPYDRIPDVRDGLTREERVVLYVLHQTQKERGDRNVPTAMLWGRVCEHFYISPEDLSEMLARLGARR